MVLTFTFKCWIIQYICYFHDLNFIRKFRLNMRMRYTLFIFLFCTFQLKAQQLDFFHFFSIPEFQAYDVKQTSDGGYLVAGGIHNINGGDFILVKTDSLGNELFTYSNDRFNGMDGSNAIYSLEIAHNNIYLAGSIQPLFGLPSIIYIVKLDSLFNKVWEIEDSALGSFSVPTKLKLSMDGNLIITGSASSDTTDKVYASKIDTNGHFIWKNYFRVNRSATGRDILDVGINEFITVGAFLTLNGSLIDTSASFILSFDTVGNINWYHDYPDTSNIKGISSLVLDNLSNIYAGEYFANSVKLQNPQPSILKFDTLGTLLWRKQIRIGLSDYVGVQTDSSGNIFTGYGLMEVKKLNSLGDSLWTYHYGNVDYQPSSTLLDNQTRMVLVGNNQSQAGHPYISYLMRISDTTLTGINELPDHKEIIVSPNPSNGIFTLLPSLLNNSIDYIEVYSVNGEKLYMKKAENNFIFFVNLSYLKGGIYILKIKLNNRTTPLINRIIIIKS